MSTALDRIRFLRDIRERQVDSRLALVEVLQRLSYLRELWEASAATSSPSEHDIAWTSDECYEFLGAVGFLWRSQLGAVWEVALQKANRHSLQGTSRSLAAMERQELPSVPGLEKLISDFEETVFWSAAIYQRYAPLTSAYAVTVPRPDAWLAWAEQLRDASELTEPDLCSDDIEQTVADVVEALRQLDQAELVCALCQLQAEKKPCCTAADQSASSSLATELLSRLPSALADLQKGLDKCVAWLHENPETFLLASNYIHMVIATLRPDLEELCDLAVTVWKFKPLVEMLCHAEGALVSASVDKSLQAAIRQAAHLKSAQQTPAAREAPASSVPAGYASEIPTARLAISDTRRLVDLQAFPREELTPLLAAASGQTANPRFLHWHSPDGEYKAVLAIQSAGATLNFYRATGQHAEELIGTPICLAGIRLRIGPRGRVVFDLTQLAHRNEPVYLDVGRESQRWQPEPSSQTPASAPQ